MRPYAPLRPRPRQARRVAAAMLVTGVVAACATPRPATEPAARTMAAEQAPARDPHRAPWAVTGDAGTWSNRIELASVLESRVDTVTRTDTSRAVLELSLSRLAGSPGGLSGLVTTYRLGVGAMDPDSVRGLLLPLAFRAEEGRDGAQARFDTPPSGACASVLAVVQPVRDLLVRPPARLEPGTSWSDSATYTICRDSIPLEVHSRRTFVVRGAEQRDTTGLVIIVDRTSEVRIDGRGLQFGEPVTIHAEGRGTMRLELVPRGGVVVAGEGEHLLEMQMRGRRRSQDLTQRTRITIAR